MLDALTVDTCVEVVHGEADEAATRELRWLIPLLAVVVVMTRRALEPSALINRSHAVSIAPASSRVAFSTARSRRNDRVIADLARVGRRARWTHIHSQPDLGIRSEADLCEASVQAVVARVLRSVRGRIDHFEIEVEWRTARKVHLGHVHVPDALGHRFVWSLAAQVRPDEL